MGYIMANIDKTRKRREERRKGLWHFLLEKNNTRIITENGHVNMHTSPSVYVYHMRNILLLYLCIFCTMIYSYICVIERSTECLCYISVLRLWYVYVYVYIHISIIPSIYNWHNFAQHWQLLFAIIRNSK